MANKLLLLVDVEALGRSGDIVNVRPGYARNFLLPQGLAVIANKHALRMQERLQEERRKQAVIDKAEAETAAVAIKDLTLTTIVKVDHEGHMYGSVTALDVAGLLQEQAGITVEKRFIQLPHALKETGVHTIKVKLKEGVTSSFVLKVMSEAELAQEAKDLKQAAKEAKEAAVQAKA